MTSFTDPDLRARHRRGARALAAVVATRTPALALAACGSSNSNSSSNSGGSSSSNSSSASSSSSSGVRQAQAQLKQYEATSTKITISESLKSTPPRGKTPVMLGTSDPNNVKIEKAYKQLCQLAGWSYQQVIYSQGDTGSFNAALDAAIAKKAGYISEAGVPLTPSGFNPSYGAYVAMTGMLRDAEGMPPLAVAQAAIEPTQILTPQNVKSVVGSSADWAEPTNALAQFKQLWHLE